MDRYLVQLNEPLKEKKKIYTSSSSSSSTSGGDLSSDSSSDTDNMYFCRVCNKNIKGGSKEIKPEEEICKICVANFPERMFCKTCKRYFTSKKPFSKAKDRCNFCFEKLEKAREARKKKGEKSEEPVQKKSKKQEHSDNYVCLYLKGQCVFKKHFNI